MSLNKAGSQLENMESFLNPVIKFNLKDYIWAFTIHKNKE